MWFDGTADEDSPHTRRRIERLQQAHRGHHGAMLIVLAVSVAAFIVWASVFQIDEVARARGEVVTGSRVQVIQSVDGGVLTSCSCAKVTGWRPGRFSRGWIRPALPRRWAKSMRVCSRSRPRSRACAQKSSAAKSSTFTNGLEHRLPRSPRWSERFSSSDAPGLSEELRTLKVAVDLATRELTLVQSLHDHGDASGAELLRAERGVNESEAALVNRRNRFLEDARLELTKAEDEIAQNEQLLIRRRGADEQCVHCPRSGDRQEHPDHDGGRRTRPGGRTHADRAGR